MINAAEHIEAQSLYALFFMRRPAYEILLLMQHAGRAAKRHTAANAGSHPETGKISPRIRGF